MLRRGRRPPPPCRSAFIRTMSSSPMLDNYRFPVVHEGSPSRGLLAGLLHRYKAPPSVVQDIARLEAKLPQYQEWADDAERHPPQLVQYDHWCRRVDRLVLAHGWQELKKEVAREGLIHLGYHTPSKTTGRLHQFTKLYMASPYFAMVTCPVAMTDGAASLCRAHGLDEEFDKLTSTDPEDFWLSGQWMTERPGGSDVGNTETVAEPTDRDGEWRVNGFKWFSSATDADISFLLARSRIDGKLTPGSRGLSLYLARVRKEDGSLNGIAMHRLKDKFGTKSLPTAELLLSDVPARLIGEPHKGVKNISPILNITRLHAAMGVSSYVHLCLNLAKSYASQRVAFGKLLKDHVLHADTLARVETTHRGCTLLVFHLVNLLGKGEDGDAQAQKLYRFLTPLAKMYVCKTGIQDILECMEAMGGQGYMEETRMGKLLRDGLANCIWEGATNVMALDLLRVMDPVFFRDAITTILDSARGDSALTESVATVERVLAQFATTLQAIPPTSMEGHARTIGFTMSELYIAALAIEHAVLIKGNEDHEDAMRAALDWAKRLELRALEIQARL
ncbi:hypothetical protein ATCC90586_010441 [Pythium insidiosum]|nr:hypothetical protein ATCC90586_010441 [Pythium insidiosum]